jgi:hypothetical protein
VSDEAQAEQAITRHALLTRKATPDCGPKRKMLPKLDRFTEDGRIPRAEFTEEGKNSGRRAAIIL